MLNAYGTLNAEVLSQLEEESSAVHNSTGSNAQESAIHPTKQDYSWRALNK